MPKKNPKLTTDPKPAHNRLGNMTSDELAMERLWLVDGNAEKADPFIGQKLELVDLAIKRREAMDQAKVAKALPHEREVGHAQKN